MTNTEYTALKAEIDLTTTNEGLAKLRTQIETRRLRSKERKLLRRIDRKKIPFKATKEELDKLTDMMLTAVRIPREFLGY